MPGRPKYNFLFFVSEFLFYIPVRIISRGWLFASPIGQRGLVRKVRVSDWIPWLGQKFTRTLNITSRSSIPRRLHAAGL